MYWTTVEKTIVCPVWEVRWGKCIPLLWLYVSKWTRSIFYLGACSAFSQLCTHFSFVLWVYVFCKPKLKKLQFFSSLGPWSRVPSSGRTSPSSVCVLLLGLPGGTVVRNLPANAGSARDAGSTSGSGRSPGRGNGNPLQYSCLKNSLDRGALWATVHGVTKSWTQLNTHTPLEPQECRRLPYTFQMLPSS